MDQGQPRGGTAGFEAKLHLGTPRREVGVTGHPPGDHQAVGRVDLQIAAADRRPPDVHREPPPGTASNSAHSPVPAVMPPTVVRRAKTTCGGASISTAARNSAIAPLQRRALGGPLQRGQARRPGKPSR